jgi:hypothetical protein
MLKKKTDEVAAARQAAEDAQAVVDELERVLFEEQRRLADEPRRQEALAMQARHQRMHANGVLAAANSTLVSIVNALDHADDGHRRDFITTARRLLDTLTTPEGQP